MKKQVILAFLTLLLGASLMSGCGKQNEPSSSVFIEATEDITSHNSSKSDYTTTSTAAALAAFYQQIPEIGRAHV